MNANWGLLPDPDPPIKEKTLKRQWKLEQAKEGLSKVLTHLQDSDSMPSKP